MSGHGRSRGLVAIPRWRAASLLAVNLLIAAHLLHWWLQGESMGRLVLSDAAQTLVIGLITPAALLFALAMLATALCGRFFCGWACHMAALQDACAALLRRAGMPPRPFRARLLGYLPLLLALYLFVWPSLKRAWLPMLQSLWPEVALGLGPVPAFPGWSLQLTSRDLWDGLPSLAVGVPFLLLCGFATVYFLGARGLCRYACPYGGVFMPVSTLAPLGVVVDASRCDGCARCTAACSAAVPVLEQLRAYGRVLDAHCVRSLDCVAACPQRALALRPMRPALLQRAAETPRSARRFDLGLGEELLVAALALATLLVTRGLYGQIPLLLAVTLGALAGYLGWLARAMFVRRDLRFRRWWLRRHGRLSRPGWVAALLLLLVFALLAHSFSQRAALWQAQRLDAQVEVDMVDLLAGAQVPVDARLRATDALRWYARTASWRDGGLALGRWPEVPLRRAWLLLVLGEHDAAESLLRSELSRGERDPALREALGLLQTVRLPAQR